MKQEGHPEDLKLFNKGANFDLDKEFLGTQQAGQYVDAHNMDLSISTGNANSLQKIRGEIIWHQKNILPSDYLCIGTVHCNGKKFEVWVDKFSVMDPVIRIDGSIVAKSDKIPFTRNHFLQHDKNESCIGGEVFLTDNNVPPMIFNVEDMITSLQSGSQKYFGDFNPDLYYVNLVAPLDIPIFKELVNVGGGGGLPVGSYQYAIMYSTDAGDRTNIGPWTPPIPVVSSYSSATNIHPGIKTYGSDPNIAFPTSFAPRLRFRVTNLANYDFIEIIRIANNTGGGNEYVPVKQVIARIDIEPGEYSVREFLDPVDSNFVETLSEQDLSTHAFIERSKTLRYHDTRLVLMAYEVAPMGVDVEELEYNGEKVFPVVEKLGKLGHTDAVNAAYYRSYMGGERYGFGINLWDAVGGKFFSQELTAAINYQYPNRRDIPGTNSVDFSYGGLVTAANINSGVTNTFEVFDHVGATAKNDICSFKNILDKGDKSLINVTAFCTSDPENVGAKVNFLNRVKSPYLPFRPTEGNDSNNNHNYVENVEVNDGNSWETYRPQGFGLNYYAHGMAFAGFDNFPQNAKAFSIVRTDPAKRVVMQGLGMYSLNPGDYDFIGNKALCTKRTNKMFFSSPDFESAQVSIDQINDIVSNPQDYTIQFVSPLGFFSEVYNFEYDTTNPRRSRIIDMVSYARVLRDSGQINPGESGVGVADYVTYNKYRNSHAAGGGFFAASDGNKTIGISSAQIILEGRGSYIEFEFDQNFYNTYGVGGAGNSDFNDAELKDWTEPFYIINIIQEGKNVRDKNIDSYRSTGHYQKLSSVIGIGDNTIGQSLELVDERWEDCIPDLSNTGPFAGRDAYVFIVDGNNNEQRWINVTFMTPAQIIIINNDIIANGFYAPSPGIEVTGMFTHTNTNNKEFDLVFGTLTYSVPTGYFVVVKYDNSMPIRVFGGDTTVGETIFAPIDRQANGEDNADEKEKQFVINLGFPFRQYRMNPRHYVVRDTTGINKIQKEEDAQLGYIRQMVMMFNCESRTATNFAYNSGNQSTQQFFPMTHYVIRPNRFDDVSFGSGSISDIANDNNIFLDYFSDYPNEWNIWKYGGFRFAQGFNSDYMKSSPVEFFSKPDVGFKENTEFCTGVIASLPRAINAQNSPGLKTFLSGNAIYLDDDQGAIRFAWDATSGGKGENLYAVTETGICLIFTKKSILSNLNADELSIMAADKFLGGEYWINKRIGCPDEMWRTKAEDSVVFPSQGGAIEMETLFFCDKDSSYRFYENKLENIGKIDYYSRLSPALASVLPGYQSRVTAIYNRQRNQYWVQLEYRDHNTCCDNKEELFVWSQEKNQWLGTNSHRFDQYLSLRKEIYGMRDLTTYKLYEGYKINGENIEGYVIQASSPVQPKEKEFIDININSDNRPTEVQFLDENFDIKAVINQANNGSLYLKKYDGWWNFIPRNAQIYSFYRDRNQSRLLVYKIIHNLAEDFKVVDVINKYKVIK